MDSVGEERKLLMDVNVQRLCDAVQRVLWCMQKNGSCNHQDDLQHALNIVNSRGGKHE